MEEKIEKIEELEIKVESLERFIDYQYEVIKMICSNLSFKVGFIERINKLTEKFNATETISQRNFKINEIL